MSTVVFYKDHSVDKKTLSPVLGTLLIVTCRCCDQQCQEKEDDWSQFLDNLEPGGYKTIIETFINFLDLDEMRICDLTNDSQYSTVS